MRPDAEVTQLFLYYLALFSNRYDVKLHAYVMLSNHYHVDLTDSLGALSDFMRDLNSALSGAINRFRSRKGRVWGPGSYDNKELYGAEAAWDRLLYVLLNPVLHDLVEVPEAWPGAVSLPDQMAGSSRTIRRPESLSGSSLPETVVLELSPPPALAGLSREQFCSELHARAKQKLERLKEERGANTILGAEEVLRTDPFYSPPNRDRPRSPFRHRVVVCLDASWERELIAAYAAWFQAYADARLEWPEDHEVIFPAGACGLPRLHGARVSRPP